MIGRLGLMALAVALAACAETPSPIRITGSATVQPFTKAVADAFVQAEAGRAAPAIDSAGTGPGIQRFCAGADGETPDIVNASRRMRRVEFDRCRANGVGEIIEVRVGLDGIVLAESVNGPKLALSRKDIYLALAANPMGKANAARTWRDANPRLPATPIKVLGPAATSGTRDLFAELLLGPGCVEANPAMRAVQTGGDPAAFDRACRQTRTDGAYVTGGENYDATVQAVERDPQALALFGYSFLEQNPRKLRGVAVDGVAPTADTIANGTYPGGRTLFLYVKKQHVKRKPELQAFLDLYATMWNPGGPLTQRGLIPMSPGARERSAAAVKDGYALDGEGLL